MKAIILALLLFLVGCATPDLQEATVETPVENSQAEEIVVSDPLPEDLDIKVEVSGVKAIEEIPINVEKSFFEFEGFGPGKSHVGSFSDFEGVLLYSGDELIGAEGSINPTSADTGINGLNNHLMSEDFFYVEMFPKISFGQSQIKDGVMIGDLTFLGQTKEVSFPVTVTENGIEGNFLLDLSPFGIKYTLLEEKVRITFEMNR